MLSAVTFNEFLSRVYARQPTNAPDQDQRPFADQAVAAAAFGAGDRAGWPVGPPGRRPEPPPDAGLGPGRVRQDDAGRRMGRTPAGAGRVGIARPGGQRPDALLALRRHGLPDV